MANRCRWLAMYSNCRSSGFSLWPRRRAGRLLPLQIVCLRSPLGDDDRHKFLTVLAKLIQAHRSVLVQERLVLFGPALFPDLLGAIRAYQLKPAYHFVFPLGQITRTSLWGRALFQRHGNAEWSAYC